MKLIKKITAFVLSFAMLGTALTAFAKTTEAKKEIEVGEGYQVWENIAAYIAETYIDGSLSKEDIMKMGLSNLLEDEEAMIEVLKKTLESLDPYSTFMTYDEYTEYIAKMDGVLFGLGVTIEQREDGVYISGFAEGSLAREAGFCENDKIVAVEGENLEDASLEEVRMAIVGELDTQVAITVERNGNILDLVGTRCAINTATVVGGILNGNIGYIQIITFGSETAQEVRALLNTFQESEVKKLIIDLRNNAGGLLNSAISLSKMLVPKGKIIEVKYRDATLNQNYYSELEKSYYETIILVNGNTASSAEIFASAMQDSGAAQIYGTNTFGKGLIQATYPLNNGSILKMTTGEYLTRNGKQINGEGIEPDVIVHNYKEKIEVGQYTKFTFTDRWSLGNSGEPIKAAKERLSMLGYFTGNATNEIFNVQLQEALKAYQSKSGLSASGVLDIPTQVKLDETFGSLEKEVDVQLQKAYEAFGGNPNELYN